MLLSGLLCGALAIFFFLFVLGVVLLRRRGKKDVTAKEAVSAGVESVSQVFRRTPGGLSPDEDEDEDDDDTDTVDVDAAEEATVDGGALPAGHRRGEVVAHLRTIQWETADVEKLVGTLRHAIGFEQLEPSEDHPIGASRVGGLPDLPKDREWPEGDEGKFAFIAQFNVSDFKALDYANQLPASGRFYVFVTMSSDICEEGVVLYSDAPADQLARHPLPEELEHADNVDELGFISKQRGMRFFEFFTLPASEAHEIGEQWSLSDADAETLGEAQTWINTLCGCDDEEEMPDHLLGEGYWLQGRVSEDLFLQITAEGFVENADGILYLTDRDGESVTVEMQFT